MKLKNQDTEIKGEGILKFKVFEDENGNIYSIQKKGNSFKPYKLISSPCINIRPKTRGELIFNSLKPYLTKNKVN